VDVHGPSIPKLLGLDGERPDAAAEGIEPVYLAPNLKVMSIGFLLGDASDAVIWRGPLKFNVIRQFLRDVAWGELDYLVIDLPPGTGDAQLSLAQSVPLSGGVIVTLPQDVSLEDASRGLYMFRELNVPIIGVVENMSYLEMPDGTRMDVFGTGGGQKLADKTGVPFLGSIPLDPSVRIGGDNGSPIVVTMPESASARALRSVAEQVAARLSVSALQQGGGVQINMIG